MAEKRRGAPCSVCGERIPFPAARSVVDPRTGKETSGVIICTDCLPDGNYQPPHSKDIGQAHDRRYNGGEFHKGEW